MAVLKVIGVGFLAVALVALVFQRNAISRVRQENESLRQQNEEGARLASENGGIPQLRVENQEVEALKAAHQDLLKLRNEVRQLRDHFPQVAKLRQENQRIESEIKMLSEGKPLRLAQMVDYVAKETWSNAGFTTPEAALQTFFWAIREGQFNRIPECFSPQTRQKLELGFVQASEEEKKKSLEGFTNMGGYRVAETEQAPQGNEYVTAAQRASRDTPPDENNVIVGIQAAAGGAVMK